MTKDEALKLAIEALERFEGNKKLWPEAITAIKEALAQRSFDYKEHAEGLQRDYDLLLAEYNDLKAQRTWVGLTDAELAEFSDAKLGAYDLCLEVEAKLEGKNNAMSQRNDVLEEVAKEFDKMPFGDTAASFAIFVRNMKT